MTGIADFLNGILNELLRDEADRVFIREDGDSVRSPGWYQATCSADGWETSGREPNVEDAVCEHVAKQHPVGRLVEGVRAVIKRHVPEETDYFNRHGNIATFTACEVCGNGGGTDDAWPCDELKDLASPFADRPGFLESWRP
jgi:hypothetical protein